MTRIERIIMDKAKKEQRQSALSASSAFYWLVHRYENRSNFNAPPDFGLSPTSDTITAIRW